MSMRWLALVLCVLVTIVGCGGSDDNGDDDTREPPAATTSNDSGSDDSASDSESTQASSGSGAVDFVFVRGARPAGRGDVTVKAPAGTECSIVYANPDGEEVQAQGLEPKTATPNGRIQWAWRIEPDTTPGMGTVTVTCGDETIESEIEILG